jgi:hypothetical protein
MKRMLTALVAAATGVALLTAAPPVSADISDDLRKEVNGYVETHLAEGDAQVKAAALVALGRVADGDEEIKKLKEYKTADDGRVRLGAGVGLMIAGADDSTSFLVGELVDQSGLYGILRSRITVLPDEKEAELLEALLDSDEAKEAVRRDVLRYLGEQTGPLYTMATDMLTSSDAKLRAGALNAVKATARLEALDVASKMLDAADTGIQSDGLDLATSISQVPGKRAEAQKVLEDAVDLESEKLAIDAAYRLLDLQNKAGVDRLVEILKDSEDVDTRLDIANTLLEHGITLPTDVVKPMWQKAKKANKAEKDDDASSPELEQALLNLTVASGDSDVFETLVKQFDSTVFSERLPASKAFGFSEQKKAIELLSDALFEGNEKMRMNAAVSLKQIGQPRGLDALKRSLRQERVPEIKKQVIAALGAIGNDDAMRTLQFNSTVRQPEMKIAIIDAIHASGNPKGMETLRMFFSARNMDVQWEAFMTAMHLKPGAGMDQIETVFRNPPQDFISDLETLEIATLRNLYEKLLATDNGRVRRAVLGSMVRIGEPMMSLLRSSIVDVSVASETREEMMLILSELKRKQDVSFMERLVRDLGSGPLVTRAAWTLAEISTPDLEASFRGWLGRDNALLNAIASYGIASLKAKQDS